MSPLPRILHVEVGGAYGGSLRVLETYLRWADRQRFVHDLLLYYPTEHSDRLTTLVRKFSSLYDSRPAVSGNPLPNRFSIRSVLNQPQLRDWALEGSRWVNLVRSVPLAMRLRRFFCSESYDLIHVNNTFTFQAPTLLAALGLGIPVVAHVRAPVADTLFARRMAAQPAGLIAINPTLEQQVRGFSPFATAETCCDGIEVPSADAARVAILRKQLVSTGATLVGSAGRLSSEKGYEYLIRAARRVVDADQNVHFAIAGEGPLRPALESLIHKLELACHVRLCGFQENIADFISALDLFACSSEWEGGPAVVLEAMLLGKPVVSTSVGYISGGLLTGLGEVVPTADSEALAAGILTALRKVKAGKFALDRARERAQSISGPQESAQRIDQVFSRVFSGSRKQSTHPDSSGKSIG
jgi:glycosyltransferase involved in cell wall biosynthesis